MLKRPCRFYNSTGKCHFGKHCKFLHDIDIFREQSTCEEKKYESVNQEDSQSEGGSRILEPVSTVPNHGNNGSLIKEEEAAEVRICKSYTRTRFCRYGNRCKYQHVTSSKQFGRLIQVNELKKENVKLEKNDDDQDQVQDEESNGHGEEGNSAPAVQKPKVKKKLCRFFKQGYCRFGKRCHFYHPDRPVKVDSKDENPDTAPPTQASAQANSNTETVEDTEVTNDWKQVTRPPRCINVYRRDEVDTEKLAELRQMEIKQLKRRFPADKLHIVNETEEDAVFVFTFLPTDPDWPFDVKAFDIQVGFNQDYPLKLFTVDVPLDQDLPATVQRYIEISLQEWIVKKDGECVEKGVVELVFRPFLRWMDRNMETIVTDGLKQLRRELTAKAAGLQFIPAGKLQKDADHQASSEPDYPQDSSVMEKDSRRPVAYRKSDCEKEGEVYEVPGHDSDGEASTDDDDDDDDDSGEGDDTVHQRPQIDPDTERRGTEMSFRNMQIWYCTTVMMEKLRLTVQCERCKNTTDFVTPPNRVNSVACSKCNNTQLVVFRPVLTHAYSGTFGYLDLDGCTLYDVILQDCHFSTGCTMCNRDILVKSFISGRVMEVWCRGCHSKMKFAADSVKLVTLTAGGVDSSKFSGKIHTVSVRKIHRLPKDPAIQEGKTLPDNGACKHYKKSFRWLRFPCCGKTFPCDLCHDDHEDHEMKYANRMICGFCCKEQPYAAERPCIGCSSALTKVRTSHWEGGHGCRDKIAMSRYDDKKYANIHKTVSNKAKALQEKNKGKKTTKLRHA